MLMDNEYLQHLASFSSQKLEKQVENLPGRIELFNWQAVLVPGDLGKVQVLTCLKDQRLKTRVAANEIGDRLVNG